MQRLRLAVLIQLVVSTAVLAQGPLTPPGAPAPTMKTLQQVEPRTPITNGTAVTISASGSYYLTTNITVAGGDAITINTSGVTLDLNGFTIASTAPSAAGTGILLGSGARNIKILNGSIQGGVTNNGSGVYGGSGFANGIYYSGTQPANVQVLRVSVSGCLSLGIQLDYVRSTVVESCTVTTIGGTGISAMIVRGSSAVDCGGHGIISTDASDCRGIGGVNSYGVFATTALNCSGTADGPSGFGVFATVGQNCGGSSASGTGIGAAIALNCYGSSSSGIGLYAAELATGCYGFNNSASNPALKTGGTANCCGGQNTGGGFGLQACIAIGCPDFGGGVNSTCAQKFLGTP
jgi:hypothetical protein